MKIMYYTNHYVMKFNNILIGFKQCKVRVGWKGLGNSAYSILCDNKNYINLKRILITYR